jgi:hypothetical protein
MADKPLLELGRARMVKGRDFSIRLPLMERLRAARGVKQAVVKVASYAHGMGRVQGMVDYISRQGKLELETESGERILDREQGKALISNWSRDFDNSARSRDAVHMVFSMPQDSKVEALRASVRTVGARAFPDCEWVFGIHEDKSHPHAHMVVKMRGREKDKKLRLNKPELYKLREIFAEAAREQGVRLAASPRAARGVGRKADRQAVYRLRQKGIIPDIDKQTARELLSELNRGFVRERPWEKAMRERNERERRTYLEYAQKLRATAAQEKIRQDPGELQKYLKAVADLERFARIMPRPKTRRQMILEKTKIRVQQKTKDRGMEMEL